MNKIVKNTVLGLVGLTLLVGLTACQNSHSKEEIQNKVIKSKKLNEKVEVNSFLSKEKSNVKILDNSIYVYTYVLKGTVKKDYCDGQKSMMRGGGCYGTQYFKGDTYELKGEISLSDK